LASQKATANALLMSGLSADLAFYQCVDLASGESHGRLEDDVHLAGSKRVRADDGNGVTLDAVGRINDRGNVASLG